MKYTFEFKLDCVEKYKKHARIETPPGVKNKKVSRKRHERF